MQKIHFDVEKICSQTEAIYRDATWQQLSEVQATGELFKRFGAVHVAINRALFEEINLGTDPDIHRDALIFFFANMINNTRKNFSPHHGDDHGDALNFIQGVLHYFMELHEREIQGDNGIGFDVIAMQSGTA